MQDSLPAPRLGRLAEGQARTEEPAPGEAGEQQRARNLPVPAADIHHPAHPAWLPLLLPWPQQAADGVDAKFAHVFKRGEIYTVEAWQYIKLVSSSQRGGRGIR